MEPVSRRAVMASGAISVLALKAGWPRAEQRAAALAMPATGVVALWTQFCFEQGATFRLAQLGPELRPTRELAAATYAADRVGSISELHAEARAFAVAAVARSWGVAPRDCCMDASTIKHHANARSVHYVAWTDFG